MRGVEPAILDGEAELGVHSAKDLPGELPEGLALVGVPAREDPTDAFIGAPARSATCPMAPASGPRACAAALSCSRCAPTSRWSSCAATSTRACASWPTGECDGIVLALAGLRRLGRAGEIAFSFALEEMTPAAGQGTLALQAPADDQPMLPRRPRDHRSHAPSSS